MNTLLEQLQKDLPPAESISPVALAYVGDTLFDLFLRSALIKSPALSPHEMHVKASFYAKAAAQAKMAQAILPYLNEEEQKVLKHARNQRSISVPKNASPVDYKWATGFESLLGYLYVQGRNERLYEIMELSVKTYREDQNP